MSLCFGHVANWKDSVLRMLREGDGHREVASMVPFERLRTVILIEKELETLADGLLRMSSGVRKGDGADQWENYVGMQRKI